MKITRKKTQSASSSDIGYGTGGRRMGVSSTPARWEVYIDGTPIGEIEDGTRFIFYPEVFGEPERGGRTTLYGNWKSLKTKIVKYLEKNL